MILINPTQSRRGFSRIGRAMQCRQKYAHERFNTQGLRGIGTPATQKGTLIGLGLGHWYARLGCWQGGVAVDAAVVREAGLTEDQKARSIQPSALSHAVIVTDPALILDPAAAMEAMCKSRPELAQWFDLSMHCIACYAEHYQRDLDVLRVIAVEVEHEITLGTLDCPGHHEHGREIIYTGRTDVVWADANGRVSIVDHKSAAAVSAAAPRLYGRDGQFFGLELLGAATYGTKFDGAKLNMVQTDGTRFERPTMPPRPWAIGNYRDRLLRLEHEIAALELRTAEYWEERRGHALADRRTLLLSEEEERLAARADLTAHTWPAADNQLSCYTRYGLCEFAALCDWGPTELSSIRRS